MCKPPQMQPWGKQVLYLSDPTGVLGISGRAPRPSGCGGKLCREEMNRRESISVVRVILLLGLILVAPLGFSQSTTKRLILKDGSYQIATKWELKGDRIRFYSAERSDWEEIPESLVDWDATNQYERDRAAGKDTPEAIALDKELEEARQEEESKSPHVAPGLRLPPEGGVYALDIYLSSPELLPLDQTSGEVNKHTTHNILRGVINPVGGSKHTIELPGPSSKVQAHAALPTLYINVDSSTETTEDEKTKGLELPWDRFRIVRAQVKGDKRIVGEIKTAVYGKTSQQQDLIPATAELMEEGWVKLTPKAPLEAGEYAVVEMLGKQGMNSYVWDFGVHANAPANLAVIKPDQSEVKKSRETSPTLEHRLNDLIEQTDPQ